MYFLGDSRVICITSGSLLPPYLDRPTEGWIHFNVTLPPPRSCVTLLDEGSDNKDREMEAELCRLLGAASLHLTSYILHLTSYILHIEIY